MVQTICRPIHTTRTEEVTCWDVAREEICLPGRNNHTRSRHKLMRKTLIREVPVIEWVVDYACAGCVGRDARIYPPSEMRLEPLGRSSATDTVSEKAAAAETVGRPMGVIQTMFGPPSGQERRKNF